MRANISKICALTVTWFTALACVGGQVNGDDGSGGTPSNGGAPPTSSGGAPPTTGAGTSGRTSVGGAPGVGVAGGFGRGGSGGSAPSGAGSANGGTGNVAQGGASGGSGPVNPGAGAGGALPKFVGNITTGNNTIDQGTRKFSTYWDEITPENAGKWGSVQSNVSAAFNWTALDAIYDYTETNHIIFKQHNFIWGSQQPGGSVDQAAVQKWMTEFCTRYPNTKLIDVVNEPPPHTTPSYANAIGGGTNGDWKWIANAFTWARAACPGAVLILNDYNDIEWPNDNAHLIDIVKKIQALNAPIDAIGAQAHDLDNGSVSVATVTKLLGQLNSETGLPVYITELDMSTTDDTAQLNLYKQYFPLLMSTEYVKGITIWGWIYGQTWSSAPNSGLIKSGAPRPAMTYLMEQLGRPAP